MYCSGRQVRERKDNVMTEPIMECSWCGEDGPSEATHWQVPVKFSEGDFHPDCHELLERYNKVTDALVATGWTRDEFMMNVDLLAGSLPETKENDNGKVN